VRARRARPCLLAVLAVLLGTAAVVDGPRLAAALRERRLRTMTAEQLAALVLQQPDDLEARYQLGLAHARAGDYPAATREFLQVLNREPGRADVLNDLGVVYLLQQRFYESLVALNGALSARPDYGRAVANLGRLHLATKMPYTAVREFERAVRLGTGDSPTLCDLGNAYQQTLNFQSARRVYEQVLRRNPRDATAWLGLARTYEGLTGYDRAAAAAQRALAASSDAKDAARLQAASSPMPAPKSEIALAATATLGRIQLQRASSPAEIQSARHLLEAAAAGDPTDAESRYDLGRALRRLGDEKGAIVVLRQALRIAPDHAGAAYQLSQALIASGQTAAGERIGAAFRQMAARSREQDMLEERVYQQPGDMAARLRLARAYAASHRTGLALLQCRQILNANPGNAEARQLMQSLSRGSQP
jgi:tetratricopeptide (TPR) repeat protein